MSARHFVLMHVGMFTFAFLFGSRMITLLAAACGIVAWAIVLVIGQTIECAHRMAGADDDNRG